MGGGMSIPIRQASLQEYQTKLSPFLFTNHARLDQQSMAQREQALSKIEDSNRTTVMFRNACKMQHPVRSTEEM